MDATVDRARVRRFQRRDTPPAFKLTERDLALIAHVARHRFLTSHHLVSLDGGSDQNVLRSLRVLFDHGYLDRPHAQLAHLPVTGPRPIVYGLGRRGAHALSAHGDMNLAGTDWTERNKRAGAIFIEHTLAVADFMVALELACRTRNDVALLREDEVIANAPEATQAAREPLRLVVPGLSNKMGVSSVVADGLFGLAFLDNTAAYFLLEVDRGSMPVTRSRFDMTSFNRKLAVYWNAWKQSRHAEKFGVKQVRVLTITDNEKRMRSMLAALGDLTDGKGSNFFLFTTTAQLAKTSPLDLDWTTGRGALIKLGD